MLAVRHQQFRGEVAHIAVPALTGGKAHNATFQSADIKAHLFVTPLLARVADDLPQVGFSLKRKNIGASQTLFSVESSRYPAISG